MLALAALFALFSAPPRAFAQRSAAIPLVPAANWRQAESQNLPVDAVRNYGGDPAIESEYGVNTLQRLTYELGKTRLDVIVELAPDPSSAYGLFTYYQTSAMQPATGIQFALSDSLGSLMVRGRNFIRFLRPKDLQIPEDHYLALLIFVGGTRPSSRTLEGLPAPLPTKGLMPGTEKYLLGLEAARRLLPSFRTDLIGFEQGAELQMGSYKAGPTPATLLAISYPTPQIARVRFGAMSSFLNLNQNHGVGSIYGRRQGSFVFLVLNADTPATASNLMDQFRVVQQVVGDERYPGDKPLTLQLLELVLANILLILILVGICIVGGILVFVSRRIAGKYFPGSDWGNPDGETLITLDLKTR